MEQDDREKKPEQKNRRYGRAPGPLHRMHIATYLGLPIAGYLTAMGILGESGWPVDSNTTIGMTVTIPLLLISTAIAGWSDNNLIRAIALAVATAMGFMTGSAIITLEPAIDSLLPVGAIAIGIGLYVALPWLWLGDPETDLKNRAVTWVPALLGSFISVAAMIRCIITGSRGGWVPVIIGAYLVLWFGARSFYFCYHLNRRPTRPIIEQACSELIRGLIIIESLLIIGFSGSPQWTVGAIMAFFLMPIAGRLSPWKMRRN